MSGRFLFRAAVTTWIAALVLLPLLTLLAESVRAGPAAFVDAVTSKVAVDALALTLWTGAAVVVLDVLFGVALAFVLVRGSFRGKNLVDAAVDLPFALPTLLPGLLVLQFFGPRSPLGIHAAFSSGGIVLVLLFVTLPFVVRAVEPVLASLDKTEEEAAASLGASTLFTFRRVVLPALAPALVTGALQSFARALAEFGSVVVVSGNIPGKTLTASSLVFREVESGRPDRAAAVSVVLLAVALGSLAITRVVRRG